MYKFVRKLSRNNWGSYYLCIPKAVAENMLGGEKHGRVLLMCGDRVISITPADDKNVEM